MLAAGEFKRPRYFLPHLVGFTALEGRFLANPAHHRFARTQFTLAQVRIAL